MLASEEVPEKCMKVPRDLWCQDRVLEKEFLGEANPQTSLNGK